MRPHSWTLDKSTFGDLPSNLVENILMRLPLNEAARTSILSRNWRYKWRRMPELIFDLENYQKSIGGRWSNDEVMMSIFEVVFLHRVPILKFHCYIPELDGRREVDIIIQYLSQCGIEDFKLEIGYDRNQTYKLSSHLFSCLQLKHLRLSRCELNIPSWFQGFSKLITLSLDEIICTVNAPNLLKLHIVGRVESLSLKYLPKLEYLLIIPKLAEEGKMMPYCVDNFIRCLSSVKVLTMGSATLKCLAAGIKESSTTTTSSSLKDLHILDVSFNKKDDISCALWLIRSSPDIEIITIEACNLNDEYNRTDGLDVLQLVKAQEQSDISLQQLHGLYMLCDLPHKATLELIRLLLAKSPNLKTLCITFFEYTCDEKQQYVICDEEDIRIPMCIAGGEL